MGISLGLVGLGSFGSAFAPLFKAHPAVDRIAFCDIEADRVKRFTEDPFYQDKLSAQDAYLSLDDICRAGLDGLVGHSRGDFGRHRLATQGALRPEYGGDG